MPPDWEVKLFFDENLGLPLVKALNGLLAFRRPAATAKHIIDAGWGGQKDAAWIPRLKDEGWVVISGDLGRRGGSKLPRLCAQHGITHILFSGQMSQARQFEKVCAVLRFWSRIEVASDPDRQGLRYTIRRTGGLGHGLEFMEKEITQIHKKQ